MTKSVAHVVRRRGRRDANGAFGLGTTTPSYAWDFVNNKARFNSINYGALANTPGWSFTRASTGYAQQTPGSEFGTKNLCLQSQTFDNASWTKTKCTITADAAVAPDGTTTADMITDDATSGQHSVYSTAFSATSGTVYCGSVFAKQGTDTRIQIRFGSGAFSGVGYADFDLSAGTVSATGGTVVASGITALANGWYRCWLALTATATTSELMHIQRISSGSAARAESYSGSSTTVYAWGAQVETGSTATNYKATTTVAVTNVSQPPLVSFASGVLRRTDKGVFIEGARTNLYLQSNNFSATWNLTNVTVTAAAETAPDGTLTAQKVQATTTAATGINQNAANNATSATFSIYVKKGSGATEANVFKLRNNTTATDLLVVDVNYDTGAINYTTGSSGVSMTALAGGWWRLVMTATADITSGNGIRCYPCFNGASETAGEYAYAWGAQLEAASFPSSYIPTTTASATRAADVLTVPVSGIDYPISLFAEFERAVDTSTYENWLGVNSGSANDQAITYTNTADKFVASMRSGSVEQGATASTASIPIGSISKGAARYAANSIQSSFNGILQVEDTIATVPAAPTTINFGGSSFSYLRRAAIWTRALTDSELQTVTL